MKNAAILLTLTLLLSTSTALGGDLSLHFVNQAYRDGRFYTDIRFDGDISYDTLDAIRNGITANMYITLQLSKSGGMFRSGRGVIAQKTESFTISFDVWENRFVLQDRSRKAEVLVSSPVEIVRQVTKFITPFSTPLTRVTLADRVFIRGKIKIQTIKLYPPFGIFLYFFDPWNYESGWFYSDTFTLENI